MTKRFNTQKIRIHQSYEIWEAAFILNVSHQTVRVLIKEGLPVLSSRRPILILGCELKAFLDKRQQKNKQPTALGEMYCMSCRKPQTPFGRMVDYIPVDERKGRLVALCNVCETTCSRFASKASLPEFSQVFEIVINHNRQA